jgi:Na+/H+ antiporter NhaB
MPRVFSVTVTVIAVVIISITVTDHGVYHCVKVTEMNAKER